MSRIRLLLLLPLAALVLLPFGCAGDGQTGSLGTVVPTGTSPVRFASADIRIDGKSVNNATIPAGSGSSSLFTVSLANPGDRSNIRKVQMDYSAHSSMGMMGGAMSVECYDDGTHGDAVAGDGTYSYMDVDGHIGPQYGDCTPGSYVYKFHGTDMMGQLTNALECRVTVQ